MVRSRQPQLQSIVACLMTRADAAVFFAVDVFEPNLQGFEAARALAPLHVDDVGP